MSEEHLSNGNGNGKSNGNGNGPFSLVAKQDPTWTKIAPKARREVIFDTRIPEGARMLYCFLCDCSLWEGVNKRPGVVRFPNSYLTRKLGVSERTIQNWKRDLQATGRIWITQQTNKNAFPTTVYNVTAIVGQQMPLMNIDGEDGSLPEEDIPLNNRRRPHGMKRDGSGKFVGGSKIDQSPKSAFSSQIADTNGDAGNFLPSASAMDCAPQRQPIAAHSGNPLPVRTEVDCRGERQPVAVGSGNGLPPGAANGCRSERQPRADNKEVRGKRSEHQEDNIKRSTGLIAKKGGTEAEKNFLSDVEAMMESWKKGSADFELKSSGVWWRLSYRADAGLMRRVLADIAVQVREGAINEHPGKAAVTLWKLWGGQK